MIDATRDLRFHVGLFIAMLGVAPTLMFALLATDAAAAPGELVPVLVGAPINAVALIFLVRGMWLADPSLSTRRLAVGTGLVVVGDAILYGLRALLV